MAEGGGVPRPLALQPLPLGSVRASGWLAGQLQLQLDGMAGHLDEFWPDVGGSSWIGGPEEGWERGPYWLDGVVPLAFLTDSQELIAKVRHWVDYILEHQEDDGWMGPEEGDTQGAVDVEHDRDIWPRMILLKALLQFHSATSDARIVPALLRLCRRIDSIIEVDPLVDWGRFRASELASAVYELYWLTGGPDGSEGWLVDLAELALLQNYPWQDFADDMPTHKVTHDDIARWRAAVGRKLADPTMSSHGVNVAMGLKTMPMAWLFGGDDSLHESLHGVLAALDEHHGQVNGLYSTDEHLGGRHPSQGTETCAVVEEMYSLEVALLAWGIDEALAARLERLTYNALPAASTAEDWGHQYDQQANQVICHVTEDRIYTDNGPDSNTFGLVPHFGCCTANRHQGWPKFVARQWLRSVADGGLTAVSYAPAIVLDTVDDVTLRVEVSGEYPFDDVVRIAVSAATGAVSGPGSGSSVHRPLHLRIPGWAVGATLAVGDEPSASVEAGTVATVDRPWGPDVTELVLRLPASVAVEGAAPGPVTVVRGPLLFSLPIDEEWVPLRSQPDEVHPRMTDYEVHPASPWNRGLVAGDEGPLLGDVQRLESSGVPFSREGARLGIPASSRAVPGWGLDHGAAAVPPSSPAVASGEAEPVLLLPYGAARLRLTAIPTVTAD